MVNIHRAMKDGLMDHMDRVGGCVVMGDGGNIMRELLKLINLLWFLAIYMLS